MKDVWVVSILEKRGDTLTETFNERFIAVFDELPALEHWLWSVGDQMGTLYKVTSRAAYNPELGQLPEWVAARNKATP